MQATDKTSSPHEHPDLTPCDYLLWGFVKYKVFVPPQPVNIPDLKNTIEGAAATITPDLLISVWQELDYRLDVYCVTKVHTSNICRHVS
jgi:hypothetical protein